MLIYLTLIVPIISILVMYLFFKDRLHWIEIVGSLLVPLVLIFGLKAMAVWHSTSDVEWYGGYAISSTYYEDWDEYIHRTCSRTNCSGSGNTQRCTTTYYDCSYVHHHKEYWELKNNSGNTFYISKGKFEELSERWGNKSFVDMNRWYHSKDGDAYTTNFNGDFSKLEPTTTSGNYENRVAVSRSIFNFRDIDSEGLFDYPEIKGYKQKCLLGIEDEQLDLHLQRINGFLGKDYQVRVYVLVWKNQPLDKALDQQQYWKNGNKNELVINIGIDDSNNVNWTYVFSWTPSENLKIDIRDYLEGKPLDLTNFFNWLPLEIQNKWVRKEFKDFAYIAVEPTTGWVIAIWFITVLSTVGIFFFCVLNDIDNEDKNEKNRYYRYNRSFSNCSGIGFDYWNKLLECLQHRGWIKDSSRVQDSRTGRSF